MSEQKLKELKGKVVKWTEEQKNAQIDIFRDTAVRYLGNFIDQTEGKEKFEIENKIFAQ